MKKVISLNLTLQELTHLRDLMSVIIIPSGVTISQNLAQSTRQELIEENFYDKVVQMCNQHLIPTGTSAPDYAITVLESPVVGIVPVDLSQSGKEEKIVQKTKKKTSKRKSSKI